VRVRSFFLTGTLLGVALALSGAARADDSPQRSARGTVSTSENAAPHDTQRFDRTAYTPDQGHLDVGIESVEFAPLDQLTFGTYVPTWLLTPLLGAPVPTGFVKVRTPFIGPVVASLRANVIYFSGASLRSQFAEAASADGSLWIVPVELAVSAHPMPHLSESLELMYVGVTGNGDADGSTTIRGSAAATSVTLSSLSEFRVNSAFAVTLMGRVLVHQDAVSVQGNATSDGTQVDFDLGVRRRNSFVACVVPGVELDFGKAHLDLGLGYGSYWLPVVELPLTSYGLVPEANLYARF
jgi:hypothetical protein